MDVERRGVRPTCCPFSLHFPRLPSTDPRESMEQLPQMLLWEGLKETPICSVMTLAQSVFSFSNHVNGYHVLYKIKATLAHDLAKT